MGVFGKIDLELDMGARKLKFFSQDHCPGNVVYWTEHYAKMPLEVQPFGFVRPRMQLDGHPVIVALDLNAPSLITLGAMQAMFGLDETAPGMSVEETLPNGVNIYRYPFKTLGTEELQINNPAIRVIGVPHGKVCNGRQTFDFAEGGARVTCDGGLSMMLGYSVLSKLHMYFSIKEKILYASPADAH